MYNVWENESYKTEGNERKGKGKKNSGGEECKDNINVWTELAKSRICAEDKEEREMEWERELKSMVPAQKWLNSYSEINMLTDLTVSVLFVVDIKGSVNKLLEETSQIRQMPSWKVVWRPHPQKKKEKKKHQLYNIKYMFTCSVDEHGCAILN